MNQRKQFGFLYSDYSASKSMCRGIFNKGFSTPNYQEKIKNKNGI